MPETAALQSLIQTLDALAPDFTSISDKIWEFSELKFHEVRSSDLLVETLKQNGFFRL